jgi:hypothetical protein
MKKQVQHKNNQKTNTETGPTMGCSTLIQNLRHELDHSLGAGQLSENTNWEYTRKQQLEKFCTFFLHGDDSVNYSGRT